MREKWKKIRLEDALDALIDYRGKTPNKTSSGIPLITAKIVKNGFIQEPYEFIAEEDYDSWMVRGFPKIGDVVLTMEAPLGEVAQINDERVALAQRIVTLRGKKGLLDNSYLKYFFKSEAGQARLKERETGTTVTGIKQSELRLVEIDVPPLSIQRRIAAILSAQDEKIELNRQTNQTLEAIAQAQFKEWFVDFNFPGATGEMQESELGPIPVGWKVAKLGDIVRIKHGFAFKGDYFSDEETDEILITPGNFRIGGGFNYSKFKYYNGDYPSEYLLNRGDLIVTMTDLSKEGDTLGYPALVPQISGKKLLHNQRIGKVEFNKNDILKTYLYFAMCQNNYRNYVLGGATGTTVKHTSPGRICDYMLAIPTTKILRQFEERTLSLLDRIEFSFIQNQALAQTRDTLLPKLMSGEIDV